MKILLLDRFVNVFKLMIYGMFIGTSLLLMGLKLPYSNLFLFASSGLTGAHIIHQSLFSNHYSLRSRVALLAGTILFLTGVLVYNGMQPAITAAVCLGFLVSFRLDRYTESTRNGALSDTDAKRVKRVSKEFITDGY